MKRTALSLLAMLVIAACLTKGERDATSDRRTKPSDQTNQPKPPPPEPPTQEPPAPLAPVDTGPHLEEDKLDTAGNVTDYARFCKQELRLPPTVLASWNCLDGVEIPLTVEGKAPTPAQYRDIASGRIGCDRPAWLGDVPCAGYAFVQKRAISSEVDGYLLCRMRSFTSPKPSNERLADLQRSPDSVDAYRLLYEFDSLGLIWTNRKTGKTCFFDHVGKIYGGRVASPDDPDRPELKDLPQPKPPALVDAASWQRNGRETWKAPRDVAESDNCVRCHDTGPVKASPWIAQALKIGVNDVKVPYHVVGRVFDVWRRRFPVAAVTTTPVATPRGASEPQACTSCHRIGSLATCQTHLDHAVGRTASHRLTNFGQSFWTRTWMPPMPEEWRNRPEPEQQGLWQERWERHLRKMKCCCDRPNAKGCLRQPLDVPALLPPVEGSGPETCE